VVLRRPYADGGEARMTIYGYGSEAAAQQDMEKWAQHQSYRDYTERAVMTEQAAGRLASEADV
jgi:hypothetical protein